MNQRKRFRGWTFSKRGVVASMLLLLITGATGCTGEGAEETVPRPVFPEAPKILSCMTLPFWTMNHAGR